MFSDRFTIFGTILLAVASGLLVWNLSMQREVAGWVDHTESVVDGSQQLLRLFVDAETGERGFLITGAEIDLEPYNQALAELPYRGRELRRLTIGNPIQQTRLDRLERLALLRLNMLSAGLQAYRDHGSGAARSLVLTGAGGNSMGEIRSLLAQFQMREREMLRARLQRRGIDQAGTAFGAGACSLLGLSFLLVSSRRQRGSAASKLSLLRSEGGIASPPKADRAGADGHRDAGPPALRGPRKSALARRYRPDP